ncbi:MAG: MFS transporter [Thaumarchaeota archaeon]|jgi:MFS family permease|nr:MFS transporter [Nitrososphaerota archaeon]
MESIVVSRKYTVLAIVFQFIIRILESYDISIIGVMLPILSVVFLPSKIPPLIASLSMLVALTVTLVFRPVGGMVLGHFADKVGRKRMMIVSIISLAALSLLPAFLPSYSQVGLISFYVFLIVRMLTGFFIGGEYASGDPFAIEWTPAKWRGIVSGMLDSAFAFGMVTVTATTLAFDKYFGLVAMKSWAWRYVFLTALVPFIIGFLALYLLKESPAYTDVKKKGKVEKTPFFSLFKRPTVYTTLQVFLVSVGMFLMYYPFASLETTILVSPPALLKYSVALSIVTLVTLVSALFDLVSGIISQLVGRRRWGLILAFMTVLTIIPAMYGFAYISKINLFLGTLIGVYIASFTIMQFGFIHAYFSERFKTSHRSSGYAFGQLFGLFIAGFFTYYVDLLHEFMVPFEGNNVWLSVSIVILIGAVLFGTGMFLGPETKDVNIFDEGLA